MSPLPATMRDRWQNRAEPSSGQGTVYWHILLHDHPQVRATARVAQERLSHFNGFHMTPAKWLHMTTLIAGSTEEISPEQMTTMLTEAQKVLSVIQPITVTLGRVLYHPEAIMIGIRPEGALEPILKAAQHATHKATGSEGTINGSLPSWTPHMTVSYSTTQQPAEPIIGSLGKELPNCEVQINTLNLVVQWGPERLWNWEVIGAAQLGTAHL